MIHLSGKGLLPIFNVIFLIEMFLSYKEIKNIITQLASMPGVH